MPAPFTHRPAGVLALLMVLAGALAACEPQEAPWPAPTPPDEQYHQVMMAPEYDTVVAFNLVTGNQQAMHATAFDLMAYQPAPGQWALMLNGAQLMQAAPNPAAAFAPVPDTANLEWAPDDPTGNTPALALATGNEATRHWVVDRGRVYHAGAQRYLKLTVEAQTPDTLTLRLGGLDDDTGQLVHLPAPETGQMVLWDAENGLLDQALAEPWHLLFTRYFHVYDSLPPGDPFRQYGVTGPLLNPALGLQVARISGQQARDLPFAEAQNHDWSAAEWTTDRDGIGFDWKDYDFELGYIVWEHNYYLIRTPDPVTTHKLRFTTFLDDRGRKGAPGFLLQRIQ